MYVNVFFVVRRLYSAVSLTLVIEQRFIKKIFIIIIMYVSSCTTYGVCKCASPVCVCHHAPLMVCISVRRPYVYVS